MIKWPIALFSPGEREQRKAGYDAHPAQSHPFAFQETEQRSVPVVFLSLKAETTVCLFVL